jgi:hypothetical protein
MHRSFKGNPMKKLLTTILAVCVALVVLGVSAGSALASAPTISVTISSPANNSFAINAPNLSFTTTGTGLLKTCTVVGNGADISEEGCTSGWNPGPLAEGTYTYGISIEKATTGEIAGATRTVTIDQTAPVVTIGGTPAAGASSSAGVALTASVTEAHPAFLNCAVDPGLWDDCGGTLTAGTFDIANAPEGTHKYWFAATDKAGNMTMVFRQITLDRIAPTASITSTGWGTETKDNTPAFLVGGSDTGGAVTKSCSIDALAIVAACNGSSFLLNDPIADGTYTVKVRVTDQANNFADASFAFSVDSTLPQVTYSGFADDRTTETTPGLEFWVEDAHATTARCGFDATDWTELVACDEGPGHTPAAALTAGTHTFWIEAIDSFGNSSSTVYTFDVVAPTQETPGGSTGATGSSGGNGQNGTPSGPAIPKVALTTKTSKVKRGKFTLAARLTLTPGSAAQKCEGVAVLSLAPKVKKAKAVKVNVKLAVKNGACTGTAKIKLPAKLKKKKAGLTVSYAGSATMARFATSPLSVRL